MGFHASIPTNNIHPTMSKACQCEIDTLHLLLAQACLAELVPNLAHVNLAFKHLLTVAALWQEDVWRLFINKLLPHNLLTQLCSCSSSLISSSTLTTPEQYFYFLSTQNYTIFELIQYYTIFYERKLVKIYQKWYSIDAQGAIFAIFKYWHFWKLGTLANFDNLDNVSCWQFLCIWQFW